MSKSILFFLKSSFCSLAQARLHAPFCQTFVSACQLHSLISTDNDVHYPHERYNITWDSRAQRHISESGISWVLASGRLGFSYFDANQAE